MKIKNNEINTKLKEAVLEAQKQEIETMENEIALAEQHIFSNEFNHKMEKLLNQNQKPYLKFVNTISKRVAVIAVVFIVVASAFFYINVFSPSDKTEGGFPLKIEEFYQPEYLPTGYILIEHEKSNVNFKISYSNEKNNLLFEQYTINSNQIKINDEIIKSEKLTVYNREIIFYENNGFNYIVWVDGFYGYKITGIVDKNEMVKMVKTIIFSN